MLWGSLSTWYRAKACAAQFKIPEWLRLAVLWIKTANRCNYILRHRTHSEVWMGEIWAATMHTIWHQNVFQKPTAIYLLELAPVSGFPAMTFPCLELEREKESQSQHPVLGDSTASDRDCFGGFTNLTSGHLGNWWITLCGWGKVMPLQSSRFLPMLHVQNNFVTFQKKTTRPLNNKKIEPSGTFRWGQARKQVKQRTQFLLSFRLAGWEYSGHPSVSRPVERGKTMGFHICSCLRHVSSRPPKIWILAIISSCNQMSPWDFETSP